MVLNILMAMKGYSTFPKSPRLKPYHQVVYCHIIGGEGLTPLQRYSYIQQPQLTGLQLFWLYGIATLMPNPVYIICKQIFFLFFFSLDSNDFMCNE